MSVIKGYPSKERRLSLLPEDLHVTAVAVKSKQIGLSVDASTFATIRADETVASGAAGTTDITIVGTTAVRGDVVKFTSGDLNGLEVRVVKVDGDIITLGESLDSDPTGATVTLMYTATPVVNADGTLPITAGPTSFVLDGSTQEVTEDTVTPSNNAPLPVKLTGVTGDVNITAGDLNVQLDHTGASADSTKIGDGVETVEVNASGEMQVSDDTARTSLASVDGKIVAVDTTGKATEAKQDASIVAIQAVETDVEALAPKLDDILTELNLKADLTETQPVSVASLPLPTGSATEAKQDALITELQLKADLSETQPVSIASQPLPTGAATEVTLSSLLTELQGKADLAETQPVSAAALPLPTGATTEAKQDVANTASANIYVEQLAQGLVLDDIETSVQATEADIALLEARLAGSLVPEEFDYIALTYVSGGNGDGEIETVVYKTGGAAGATVATLTLGYDASDRLNAVTRS